MPRVETNLGEMTQYAVGGALGQGGLSGARWNNRVDSQPVQPQHRRSAPPPKPHKRPCCQTCAGHKCVGNCRF
jgi:hypothetical protein